MSLVYLTPRLLQLALLGYLAAVPTYLYSYFHHSCGGPQPWTWMMPVAIFTSTFVAHLVDRLPRPSQLGIAAVLMSLLLLLPWATNERGEATLTACKSNLKNIWHEVEQFELEKGAPPDRLSQLIPNYLRAIPSCPSYGEESYSKGYRKGVLFCTSNHHCRGGVCSPCYPRITIGGRISEHP